MRRLIVVTVTVVAAIALGGWAYAETQPADPRLKDSPAAAQGVQAGRHPALGVLKRAIHAELLVGNPRQGYRTVVLDRGRITAISADSITIERPDGKSVTAELTDETTFNGTPRDQLQAGDEALVVQQDGSATRVLSKGARAGLKGRRQGAGNDLATLDVS